MEIVAVYTFSENSSEHPEPDLVCLLMDFVTQRPQGSSCRALNSSPHLRLNAVEPTPSVKTFFLQLVLKHRFAKLRFVLWIPMIVISVLATIKLKRM